MQILVQPLIALLEYLGKHPGTILNCNSFCLPLLLVEPRARAATGPMGPKCRWSQGVMGPTRLAVVQSKILPFSQGLRTEQL